MTRWLLPVLVLPIIMACTGDAPGDTAGAYSMAAEAEGPTEAETAGEDDGSSAPLYLDVRTPDEWAQGRVEGAVHIPLAEIRDRLSELEANRDDPIIVYCRTGNRSGQAIRIMRQAGFSNLVNGGGLDDLERRGVPTER